MLEEPTPTAQVPHEALVSSIPSADRDAIVRDLLNRLADDAEFARQLEADPANALRDIEIDLAGLQRLEATIKAVRGMPDRTSLRIDPSSPH